MKSIIGKLFLLATVLVIGWIVIGSVLITTDSSLSKYAQFRQHDRPAGKLVVVQPSHDSSTAQYVPVAAEQVEIKQPARQPPAQVDSPAPAITDQQLSDPPKPKQLVNAEPVEPVTPDVKNNQGAGKPKPVPDPVPPSRIVKAGPAQPAPAKPIADQSKTQSGPNYARINRQLLDVADALERFNNKFLTKLSDAKTQ